MTRPGWSMGALHRMRFGGLFRGELKWGCFTPDGLAQRGPNAAHHRTETTQASPRLERAMFDPWRPASSPHLAASGLSLIGAMFTRNGLARTRSECRPAPERSTRRRAFSTLRPRRRSPEERGAVGEGWETRLRDLNRAMFDPWRPAGSPYLRDHRPEFDWGDVHSGRLPMVTRLPPILNRAPQAAS